MRTYTPLCLTADKRENFDFPKFAYGELLLSANCYAIVSKEKRKVLEGIMRSDKRIKSMQITTLINQKGRGGKTIQKRLMNTTNYFF